MRSNSGGLDGAPDARDVHGRDIQSTCSAYSGYAHADDGHGGGTDFISDSSYRHRATNISANCRS
ncbi:hypothetical protein KIN20_024058 [Parelaphostrongylus tenuis]|uniref:Uncharacterized protein n=1 Tax=Parelaphostrongylus tenuis TaxID=148309 RepID=A0AAD5QXJ4_PARTN|nr:hypothetical protein KIN20_024058 [Parelaphostrongylus tenuis]